MRRATVVRSVHRRRQAGTTGTQPDGDGGGLFGRPPPRVGVKKGMNRFTWDLRYEGATVFPGMIMWAAQPARGPLAPPADYHRPRVTAGGETEVAGLHDRHRHSGSKDRSRQADLLRAVQAGRRRSATR